jgi:hypothetical protein
VEELAPGDGPAAVDVADHRRQRDLDVVEELLTDVRAS